MKFKIGDKVVDIHSKRKFTIRDILSHPNSWLHPTDKVCYVFEEPVWFEEHRLEYDPQWVREQKLNQLGI